MNKSPNESNTNSTTQRFQNSNPPWPQNWNHWWVEYNEPIACDLKALVLEVRASGHKSFQPSYDSMEYQQAIKRLPKSCNSKPNT